MRLTKINQKDVDAAVELLKSESKKVSVGNIAEYCGVDKPLLYWFIREGRIQNSEIIYNPRPKSEYKGRKRSKVAHLPTFAECPKVELIEVTPTLIAYINHIIDNYFVHYETLTEVLNEIKCTVAEFNSTLFHQAFNTLVKDKILVKHISKDAYTQDRKSEDDTIHAVQKAPSVMPVAFMTVEIGKQIETLTLFQGDDIESIITKTMAENPSARIKLFKQVEEIFYSIVRNKTND